MTDRSSRSWGLWRRAARAQGALSEDALSGYLDDELDAATRAAVEARLEVSSDWRAVLADVRAARDAVRSLPARDAPPEFWTSVLSAANDSGSVVTLDRHSEAARRRRTRWVTAAASVAAAAAVVGFAVVPGPDRVRPRVATIADSHATRASVDDDAISSLASVGVRGGLGR
jgi:anti-sigma factor RsiW